MFILKFILFIFLAGLFVILFLVFGVLNLAHKARKQFKGRQQTGNTNGQAVTDTRSPEQSHRKIIADDEGEYVEYEEL